MSLLAHPASTGTRHFFTLRLAPRHPDLLTKHVDLLRAAVRQTKAERPFDIDAWVTLPDHLHCIWRLPPGDQDAATRWSAIKVRFARSLPGGPRARRQDIWRSGVWEHHIRGPQEHKHLIRYCWMNPVKHDLVENALDWTYSSFHRDRFEHHAEACAVTPRSANASALAAQA